MPDVSVLQPHHIDHAVRTVHAIKHVAHVAPVIHYIQTGYSMITLVISNLFSAAIAAGLSWYVRGRGVTGVQTDLANAQAELSILKTKAVAEVAAVKAVV